MKKDAERAEAAVRKAAALRANLKRRKAAGRKASDGATGVKPGNNKSV